MESKILQVLIVDDDPNLLATMRDILRVKGFGPIPARTAAAALAQIREKTVDVALIDLQLEDMPGLDLLRAIKTNFPGTECILLTGHASQSSAIAAINAGAYSYFQKPCDVDQLILSIQRAGEKRAAEGALRASEAYLQAVLQSTADGILAVGKENKVLYANGRFAEMWHIPPEIMTSQDDTVLLQYVLDQLTNPEGFREIVQQLYQSEEESLDTVSFKDGRVFEWQSRPLIFETVLQGRVWSFRDITARKKGEEALRRSEAQYRLLANNISDVIWVVDLQTERVIYASPSVETLRGYSAEEVLAQGMSALFTQASFESVKKILSFRLEQAKKGYYGPYLDELEQPCKGGGTVWVETIAHCHLNLESGHWEVYGVSRDITKRKQAEAALRESEERFRVIFEKANDAIHIENADDQILEVNSRMCEMMGYNRAELLQMHVADLQAPEVRQSDHILKTELARHGNAVFEGLDLRRDGRRIPVEISIARMELPSGELYVSVVRDISERKQAEAALQASEKRFRALIENNTDAIVLVDPRGSVMYESPAYGRMMGRDIRQRLGRSSFEYIHPEDRPTVVNLYDELVQDPGGIAHTTFRNQHADGSWHWFEATATNLLGESAVQAVVINLHDITERKQAEENIRQRLAELEVLYETGLTISGLLEPKEIGKKVLEVLADKLSWRHASVRLYHPETQRMELLVFNRPGLSTQQLQAAMRRLNRTFMKLGQGFSGWTIQHGQPIRSGNVNADPRYIRTFKGIQSGLYVPMLVGDRTVGVIGVESEQAGAFTEADERLLATLATQAGIAIENARLLAESLRQVEELGALADVSSALRTALTRPEILLVILDRLMMGSFHTEEACLIAYDPGTGANVVEAASGKWQKYEGLRLEPGEGLSGRVAENRFPYQSDGAYRNEWLMKGETADRSEALAGVPLLVQGQFIGSLWVGRTGGKKAEPPLPFTSSDMRLLGSIADMSANALQRASMHALAIRHAEELLTINTMGRVLAETLDLDQIYEKLDEIVWQLLADISHVAIALYDAEKKQITCVWFNGEQGRLDTSSLPPVSLESPREGAQSEAIHTRQPVILNNLSERQKEISFEMNVGTDNGRVTQSGLYVPMLVHGQVIGVMQVQSYTLNRFSQSEADLLSMVANTAAVDIENARLFAETQKRLHNLAALHEIDVAISASVDIHVTLSILLEQTVSELHVDAAAVLLLNPLARTLEYAAHQGFRNHQLNGVRIPLGAGLAGQAALRRQVQSVSGLQDGIFPLDGQKMVFDIYDGEGFMTHHAMPLSAKGQLQGVLEVFHRSAFQPDDEWFTFLETLSRQAAIAIDNNSLFEDLQRSNTNIVIAYDATIQGWAQALELRDKETEGHSRRVTDLTVQLAKFVGVPSAELEHVRRGTLLHDIGKMGIPDAILLKPGPLTEAEWSIMRRHPVLAYEMLSSIAYLRPALDIPHYHHEKWDGTGYPDGLKGDQIPLYARIFAVVDAYDALTNDRLYRATWTTEQAIQYIREESGKHFDPAIVEAFLNMLAREK